MPATHRATALILLSLFAIGALTLGPAAPSQPLPGVCLFCGPLGGVDFLLNVALFLPLGVGLRLRWGSPWLAVAAGAVLTLAIESLQWRVVPGRDASVGDLVANTLGTGLGAWIAAAARSWLTASGPIATRRAWQAAALAGAILGLTSLALVPLEPRYPLRVQWAPRRPGMDPFPPRQLLSFDLNGVPMRPAAELVRGVWLGDSAQTEARLRLAAPFPGSTRRSIIARLANYPDEGLYVALQGEDLLFRVLSVGSRWKLRTLTTRLDGAFYGLVSRRDTVDVTVTSTRHAMSMAVGGPASRQSTVRRTPGIGWTLLLPWDLAASTNWWLANTAWIAGLFLPTAFFATRARRADSRLGASHLGPLLGLTAVLIVVPLAAGISAAGWSDWLGVLVGIGGGVIAARLIRRTPSHLAPVQARGQV